MLEFIGGILMSLGGSVPGVSGGTIAFLMGFFDRMILSAGALFSDKSNKKERLSALFFLLRLGAGFLIGLALATFLVTRFFEENIYHVSSAFLGVTLFSVPVVLYEEREAVKRKPLSLLWIVPGAALIVGMTMLAGAGLSGSSGVLNTLLAFPCGILVACAMIMPGISGAAIFMIFGYYQKVFDSLHALLHFDFSVLPFVISLGLGAVLGLIIVIKGVKWLLKNQRARTVCAIAGTMLGSLYSIVRGPETLDPPQRALDLSSFSPWMFVIGALVILAFEGVKILVERKRNSGNNNSENKRNKDEAPSHEGDTGK